MREFHFFCATENLIENQCCVHCSVHNVHRQGSFKQMIYDIRGCQFCLHQDRRPSNLMYSKQINLDELMKKKVCDASVRIQRNGYWELCKSDGKKMTRKKPHHRCRHHRCESSQLCKSHKTAASETKTFRIINLQSPTFRIKMQFDALIILPYVSIFVYSNTPNHCAFATFSQVHFQHICF